jgi:hypothetical protein
MPEAKKEVYYKQEEQGREQFLKRKQQLNTKYTYKTNPRNKVPVRFRTPYMFFIKKHKEQLNSHSKLENINTIKQLTEVWHNMSKDEKNEYVKMTEEDKNRYDRDVEQFMLTCMKYKEKKIKKKEKIERFLKQFLENKIMTGDESALDNFKFEEVAKREKGLRKSLKKFKKDSLIFNVSKKKTNKKKRVVNINDESIDDNKSQSQCLSLSLSQCPSHEISLNPLRHNSNIFKELNYHNKSNIENDSIDDEEESNSDFFDLEEENQFLDLEKILEDKLKNEGEEDVEDSIIEEVSMDKKHEEEDSEMDDIKIDELNEEELNELLKYKLLKMNTDLAKTIAISNKHSQSKPATIKQILKKTK